MRDYLEELLRALAAEEETEETPARWQTEVEFPPAEGRAPEQESEALADILEAAGSAAAVSLWGELPETSPLLPPLLDQGGQSLEESWNSGDREQAEWFPGDGARLSSRFPLLSLERDSLSLSALEQENDRRRPALLEQLRTLERAAAQAAALPSRRSSSLGDVHARSAARSGARDLSAPAGQAASYWGGAQENRLGGTDPAQAVDRAFQRDSRRYDRGFSLY